VAYDDYTGFTRLWDGATFTNWDGESDVWSIVDGTLHADTTKTPGQHHIHYKGPGAVMRDFDLKVEVKLSATGANGGIQYRSRLLHESHGGSIGNPLGNPLPEGITTFEQAIAAGLTTRPAPGGREVVGVRPVPARSLDAVTRMRRRARTRRPVAPPVRAVAVRAAADAVVRLVPTSRRRGATPGRSAGINSIWIPATGTRDSSTKVRAAASSPRRDRSFSCGPAGCRQGSAPSPTTPRRS
jgi:hypothetical protein